MKYFIITGTSSGLGEALATIVIEQKHRLFCISRRDNINLKVSASEHGVDLFYYAFDLTNTREIESLMTEIFNSIDTKTLSELVLINNAGVVEPVCPLGKCSVTDIQQHVSVNLTAPIALANEFIRLSNTLNIKKSIINISSGAASNPYYGWSLYCSTKAALDMLTRTVGLEQGSLNNPVNIISIAPGVVDTHMQEVLRQTDQSDFPMKPRFEELHENNQLVDPLKVALEILSFIDTMPVSTGEVLDLRK